jgi:hypothetical protein
MRSHTLQVGKQLGDAAADKPLVSAAAITVTLATLLHGSRERRSSPLIFRFLHDADGFLASKLQHPVQDSDSDGNLSGPPAVRVRS